MPPIRGSLGVRGPLPYGRGSFFWLGGGEEALVGTAGSDFDVYLAQAAGAMALVCGGSAVAVDSLVGVATLEVNADVGA